MRSAEELIVAGKMLESTQLQCSSSEGHFNFLRGTFVSSTGKT